ncbi:MAG TPA: LysR family transcriptional regulator [Chloroflexota bacterium]|jgi:DNA-binding transcriptional LysR family regulator
MNLHRLQLFRVVVERGSFSLASRELFISQPALSIQIKRLEESLGLELLQRSRNGVAPTPAGKELYAAASVLLEQAQATERRLRALRAGEAGSLVVGASHTGALYFVADLVAEFTLRFPLIAVDIEVERQQHLVSRLQSGSLDVVLNWGPTVPAELDGTLLLNERFDVMASPHHSGAASGTLSREEYMAAPHFMLQHGEGAPSFMELWLLEHDLLPPNVKRLPSIDAIKRLVEANLGLTILSHTTAEREVAMGRLVPLKMEGFTLDRPLMLFANRRHQAPVAKQFSEFARAFAATRGAVPEPLPV